MPNLDTTGRKLSASGIALLLLGFALILISGGGAIGLVGLGLEVLGGVLLFAAVVALAGEAYDAEHPIERD